MVFSLPSLTPLPRVWQKTILFPFFWNPSLKDFVIKGKMTLLGPNGHLVRRGAQIETQYFCQLKVCLYESSRTPILVTFLCGKRSVRGNLGQQPVGACEEK